MMHLKLYHFKLNIHTQILATKPAISLSLRANCLSGSRFLFLCLLLFLGIMNPSAWSNKTKLKNSHKAMKIKRRLESIVNVPGE